MSSAYPNAFALSLDRGLVAQLVPFVAWPVISAESKSLSVLIASLNGMLILGKHGGVWKGSTRTGKGNQWDHSMAIKVNFGCVVNGHCHVCSMGVAVHLNARITLHTDRSQIVWICTH